jgi:hypothetical protein
METDLNPIIENQIKLIAKAQNLALIELNEKTSGMVETHLNLLFELYNIAEIFWDEDDGEDDAPVDAPTPAPEDSKRY